MMGVYQKTFGFRLEKGFRKTDKSTLVVRGFFTSDNQDEMGDVITREATERAIPKYKQWGNIRYMHLPRPVARVLRIGAADGLGWNEVEIEVIDPEAVFMVENGLLPALSVGILVDLENVEQGQTGGVIINDYQLAEISLVDHPANYDAKLKDLSMDQGVRLLARQYGLVPVAQALSGLLAEETEDKGVSPLMDNPDAKVNVEEPVDAPVAAEKSPECREENEQAADCVARKVPEIMDANPGMAEAEAQGLAESMCGSDCAPAEDVSEDPAEDAPEKAETEPDDQAILMDVISGIPDQLTSLFNEIAALRQAVEALTQADKHASEDTPADEAPVGEKAVDEAQVPADRKGLIPQTELPGDAPEQKDIAATSLRQALTRYFDSRK